MDWKHKDKNENIYRSSDCFINDRTALFQKVTKI